jgi:hypothetical protein
MAKAMASVSQFGEAVLVSVPFIEVALPLVWVGADGTTIYLSRPRMIVVAISGTGDGDMK